MTIRVRRSEERAFRDHGWLRTRYTFSFADYLDPAHMGFRGLRVVNEDVIAPASGFGEHGHRDMEILTFVLAGALEHRDSMGSGAVIRPGEVQRMSAGRGVRHSEFNPQRDAPTHLYQVWILPEREGTEPSYEQRAFPPEHTAGRFGLLVAPRGEAGAEGDAAGALSIGADARVFAARLAAGERAELALAPGRHAWVQVAEGEVDLSGTRMRAGDGAALTGEPRVALTASEDAHVLVFDLA